MLNFRICLALSVFLLVSCSKDWSSDEKQEKWYKYSKQKLDHILNRQLNGNIAKNLIIFLGDGMGLSTVTVT